MGIVIGEVTAFALGIALSPFPVVPAVLLLFTQRPRTTAGAFLAGWASGIVIVTAALSALAAAIEVSEETPAWASWTKAGLGVILLLAAVRQWRSGTKGAPAWMQALTDSTPAKALRLGLLLSAANPKVLLLSAAAGLTIGAAELGPGGSATALLVFTAIASSTVALPLLLHLVAGDRILAPLERARTWLETHNARVTAVVLAAIGVLLVIEGSAGL
ncbi:MULTISPECIES: GAP family protein [unclassified Streptomyces]|uniref:GAP family protein n=1 Tax=unclassified Streptomyces TaxID=2593676 RepID=UPI0033A18968